MKQLTAQFKCDNPGCGREVISSDGEKPDETGWFLISSLMVRRDLNARPPILVAEGTEGMPSNLGLNFCRLDCLVKWLCLKLLLPRESFSFEYWLQGDSIKDTPHLFQGNSTRSPAHCEVCARPYGAPIHRYTGTT